MNKEQLIEQLRNLQSHLPQGELDSTRLSTETAIEELRARLADNSNYTTDRANFFNAGRRASFERTINRNTEKATEARNTIAELENSIAADEANLATLPDRIAKVETEFNDFIRTFSANVNPTPEEEAENTRTLEGIRAEMAEYRNYEAELRGNIVQNRSEIETLQANVQKYDENVQRNQTLLANFTERVNTEAEKTNVLAKLKDEEALRQLEATQYGLESEFVYSNLDLGDQLEEMVQDLETGVIDVPGAIEALKSYRDANISNDFLSASTEEREREIEEIERAKSAISMELSDLETKLSDEHNYELSAFVAMAAEDKIIQMTERRNAAEAALNRSVEEQTRIENDGIRIENEISASEASIRYDQSAIEMRRMQINRLNPEINGDLIERLNNQIKDIEDRIAIEDDSLTKLRKEQEVVKNQLTAANERIVAQDGKVDRYDAVIASMKKSNENIIDNQKMRLDEARVAKLKAASAALDSRKEFLQYDFAQELNNLINENDLVNSNDLSSDNNLESMLNNQKGNTVVDPVKASPETQNSVTPEEPAKEKAELAVYKEPIGVAAIEPANEKLKENAKKKRLLDRFKDKLKEMASDWKKNWSKYVAAFTTALALGLAIQGGIDMQNAKAPDPTDDDYTIEQESDQLTDETSDLETQIDAALDDIEQEKDNLSPTGGSGNGNVDNTKDDTDSITIPGGSGDSTSDITGGEAVDTVEEVVDNNIVVPPAGSSDENVIHEDIPDPSIQEGSEIIPGTVIDTTTTIEDENQTDVIPGPIHEETIDPTAPTTPSEVITGGEQIGETVEEVVDNNVIVPDGTIINNGNGGSYEEEVDNNVVLPELGDGEEIVPNATSAEIKINEGETLNYETTSGTVSVDSSGTVSGNNSAIENITINDDNTVTVTLNQNDSEIIPGEMIGQTEEEVDLTDLSEIIEQENLEQQLSRGGR